MVALRSPAAVGFGLVILYATIGWWKKWTDAADGYSLLALGLVLLLVLGWAIIRWRRSGEHIPSALRRWIFGIVKGAAITAMVLALLGAGWIAKTEWEARRTRAAALAKWAKIGKPMSEFEKQFTTVEENESFRELTRDLAPLGISTLYKASEDSRRVRRGFEKNTFELPDEVAALREIQQTGNDYFIGAAQKSTALEARRDELTRIYQAVLSREAPVWSRDLADIGPVDPCDFMILRKLSQLIATDAGFRMANGDPKGAAQAVQAGLKITENFKEQPLVISCMMRVAIQGLFARPIAQLPEDPQAWEQLTKDYDPALRQLFTAIQSEALGMQRVVDRDSAESVRLSPGWVDPLPSWTGKLYAPSFVRFQAAKNTLMMANQTEAMERTRGILSEEEQRRVWDPSSLFTPNYFRASDRIHGTFLLREQAEMIRFSRARLREGKTHAEHASMIVPGAKWVMTGDLATNSATVKLTPVPQWAINSPVCGPDFFLLPLNGSQAWKFAPAK